MSFPSSPTNNQTAIVNNTIYSYSTSTNAWTRVQGALTATTLTISGTAVSNSTLTGALIVAGGVGIGGNLYVGGQVSGNLSGSTVDGTNSVGFLNTPQNAQPSSYTLVLSDAGKHIFHASGSSAATYTIPANASVAFAVGTVVAFVNMASAAVTIAISSDTLTWAPGGSAGSRTLAQNGIATAIKTGTTTWMITGTGLS